MSDRLRQLADRVSDFLVRMDIDPDRNGEGIFLLKYGSTVVMISIFEDDDHSFVRFASTLLSGARPQLELVMRLLRMNTEVLFGAFLYYGAKLVRQGPDVPEAAHVPPGTGGNRPLAATAENL